MRPHVWHVSLLALSVSLRLYTCLCPPACLCSDEGHVAVTCINSSLEVNFKKFLVYRNCCCQLCINTKKAQ